MGGGSGSAVGAIKGGAVGAITGAAYGAAVGSMAGGVGAVPGAIAGAGYGGATGAVVGYKGEYIKKEVSNFSGITDQENKAKREMQRLNSLLYQKDLEINRPDPANKIVGQSEGLSAANSEAQRRKLVSQLRGGLASTIKTGSSLLGSSNVYTAQATNAKSLLGQ